jgi:hypothetical protein
MTLPLFVVSTADSEGVLGVLTIGTYYCCSAVTVIQSTHASQNIPRLLLPYKCYTHTTARNWVSHDLGTDFRNFFWKQTIKILLTCCIIQEIYTVKECTEHEGIILI